MNKQNYIIGSRGVIRVHRTPQVPSISTDIKFQMGLPAPELKVLGHDKINSSMKQSAFEIRETTWGEEYFVLKAPNGKIVLMSESYRSRQSLLKGVESVRNNVNRDSSFDHFVDVAGKYRFRLKAKNNRTIGTSEAYNTKLGRWTGIRSVKRNAPKAQVVTRDQ